MLVVTPIQQQAHLYFAEKLLNAREIAIQEIHPCLAGQLLLKPWIGGPNCSGLFLTHVLGMRGDLPSLILG